ncbi:MAG: 2-oxoacid:ferredoxin oxidoreductase subunit gamma [Desulfobulbaceae bacterium BRH_c16a]|nr:MAG: 2-oxoacid:ferredoxin oxidoreductase subunit gamma [Desulfobulbaceae bacterium BRH_c16a]
MCNERILCAGFGGQGVMSLGQLLTYAGMIENKHVTWLPSYGPEMRGGTAYCSVVVSDTPVGSPIVTRNATCVIVMNLPSLLKFEQSVAPGGVLLVNSSLIDKPVDRQDIRVFAIAANDLAAECGNARAANMIMLGAYLALSKVVSVESVALAFKKVFGEKAHRLLDRNILALHRGAEAVLGTKQAMAA